MTFETTSEIKSVDISANGKYAVAGNVDTVYCIKNLLVIENPPFDPQLFIVIIVILAGIVSAAGV